MPAPVKAGGVKLPAKILGQKPAVVLLGVAVAVGAGLYLRKHMGGSGSSGGVGSAAQDSSGGAGSSAATPADLTPIDDLAWAINGLSGVLGAGGDGGFSVGSTAGGDGAPTEQAAEDTPGVPTPSPVPDPAPAATAPTYPITWHAPGSGNLDEPGQALATPIGTEANTKPQVIQINNTPHTVTSTADFTSPAQPLPAQQIPEPPHQAATKVMPDSGKKKPVSGYSEKSTAKQLH